MEGVFHRQPGELQCPHVDSQQPTKLSEWVLTLSTNHPVLGFNPAPTISTTSIRTACSEIRSILPGKHGSVYAVSIYKGAALLC